MLTSKLEIGILLKIFLLLLILVVQGCMEVSDFEGNPGADVLVVDGEISNEEGPYLISLSLVSGLNEKDRVFIENAVVKLSDSFGNSETLENEGRGVFRTNSIQGKPGSSYSLEINYKGKLYQALSKIPDVPELDYMDVQYQEESILRDPGYYINIYGLNTGTSKGYIRALVYKNNVLINPLGIDDVFLSASEKEGSESRRSIIPIAFQKSDTIEIKLINMEKEIYQFYFNLLDGFNTSFDHIPTNPDSNISNGAMGLFKAVSITRQQVIID